jgi:hypothetical protein
MKLAAKLTSVLFFLVLATAIYAKDVHIWEKHELTFTAENQI